MYTEGILATSPLTDLLTKNLTIDGPLRQVKRHIGRALLDLTATKKTFVTLDAYRLIEIFLGEDKEHETQHPAVDADMFLLLLGFADPRNKYLPELIMQVLARRELREEATWVILGIPRASISMKYGSDLASKLESFKPVEIS